jgi:hypothetical protein
MPWNGLLPDVDKEYTGLKISFYFFILFAIVSTVRSLIHIFAPDGGAGSIAGIMIEGQGGTNIVAMFAQWGVIQLLLAILYWVVIFRYRFLVPMMLVIVAAEQLFRMGAGLLKPLIVANMPPGAVGSRLLLPLAVIALIGSLYRDRE